MCVASTHAIAYFISEKSSGHFSYFKWDHRRRINTGEKAKVFNNKTNEITIKISKET